MTILSSNTTIATDTSAATVAANDVLTILAGVNIQKTFDDGNVALITSSASVSASANDKITNLGTIASFSGAMLINGDSSTVFNYGSILGLGSISASKPIQTIVFNSSSSSANPETFYNTLVNHGTISSSNSDAIKTIGAGALIVQNYGSITEGFSLSQSTYAIHATGTSQLLINNYGQIIGDAISASYVGLANGVGATWQGQVLGYSQINNEGSLSGTISDTFDVENSGTIIGAITTDPNGSIGVDGGTASTIRNSGVIHGDITFTGAGVGNMLVNSGLIDGAVTLSAGSDVLDSTGGTITGVIVGGLGADTITGGDGREVIYGDDLASAATNGGNDTINAGGGNDAVYGGYGADVVYGGYGDDVLSGGYGADALYGNQGDDVIYGNQDNDWIHGGQGDDVLYGGQGNDTLNGGVGNDVLYGGVGNDTFVFSPGFGHDTVADFSNVAGNADVIQFQPGTFSSFQDVMNHAQQLMGGVLLTDASGDTVYLVGVTTGSLTAGEFVFG